MIPPLPLIDGTLFLDNSGWMENIMTCHRRLEYSQLLRRISSEESTALNFGTAIHSALDLRYKIYGNQPVDILYNDQVASVLSTFFDLHPTPLADHRTLNHAIEIVKRYNDKYGVEEFDLLEYDEPVKCNHCNGSGTTHPMPLTEDQQGPDCHFCAGTGKQKLMVELPFALHLYDHQLPANTLDKFDRMSGLHLDVYKIPIFYSGRIDLPLLRGPNIFVMDHKTTSMLGKGFFDEKKMSAQQKGYCFYGDTELLTRAGWVKIDSLPKDFEVAQWNNGTISFAFPSMYFEKEIDEELICLQGSVELLTTQDHRLIAKDRQSGKYKEFTSSTLPLSPNYRLPCAGKFNSIDVSHSDSLLQFCVMVQADGHITASKAIRFHFSLSRKIERCRINLKKFGIIFTETVQSDTTTVFYISSECLLVQAAIDLLTVQKEWSSFLLQANFLQLEKFLEEVVYWDGSDRGPKGFIYSTSSQNNANWIQIVATLVNRRATIHTQEQEGKLQWRVNVALKGEIGTGGLSKVKVPFKGKVYCVNVPSSYLITRRKNVVVVAGNCWAFEQLTGKKVHGYAINAIRTLMPTQATLNGKPNRKGEIKTLEAFWDESLQREWFYLSEGELDEWKNNTIDLIEEFFWHYSRGYMPMKTAWCVGKFGQCPYLDVCSLHPASDRKFMLESGNFQDNVWSPLIQPSQGKVST